MKRSRATFNRTNSPETISTLANRVLFSEDLSEKLRLTDRRSLIFDSGDPFSSCRIEPGRPDDLQFAASGSARPALPSAPRLVNESSRGILLHFFANHELLAAELMALALLKFPDAPTAFRKGLANTLREEQIHTKWYVERMRQCGVEFGQYPVSRFFWDVVSEMECPLDYVSRLSLTFEQANLDYSKHFAGLLREAGDEKSAAILQRIYEDEITHVGYGLSWFRKWKEEEKSDWSALQSRLPFPLSPSRAKGNRTEFNREGRKAAGFSDDYIDQLELFERSKGRTPNVFYFNPEAENRAAAFPKTYCPPRHIESVIRDLEILPAFLARRDDVLLLRRAPSQEHRSRLKEAGLTLPEIVSLDDKGRISEDDLLRERKLHEVRPWGKAPDLTSLFGDALDQENDQRGSLSWQDSDRELYSKAAQGSAFSDWFGESHQCLAGSDFSKAARDLKDQGWEEGIVKRPFSTAGGGMRRIALDDAGDYSAHPMSGKIVAEGGLLLEPRHERIFDFSVQFEVSKAGIRLLGPVAQVIAPFGGYRGSISFPKFCKGLGTDLSRFLMTIALPVYEEDSAFVAALLRWARQHDYRGPLGIDSYIWRRADGELQHRVLCEINPRYTMGRVALELRRQIAPGHGLRFTIEKASELEPALESPLTGKRGAISGGCVILNEITDETVFAARLTVAKTRAELDASAVVA